MNGMVEKAGRFLPPELLSLLSSRAMVISFALLLLLDLIFVSVHFAHLLTLRYGLQSVFQDVRFSIETESGFSEHFEYVKTAVCVFALLGCWVRTRQPIYAAAAFAFGFVLADNAFEIHEHLGVAAMPLFMPAARAFETAPQALGEAAAHAAAAVMVFGLIALAYPRSGAEHRRAGLAFVALLVALGAFGAGVDLVHAAIGPSHNELDLAFGLLEDGGELVILSAICALSLAAYAKLAAERHGRRRAVPGAARAGGPRPQGVHGSDGAPWLGASGGARRRHRAASTIPPKP